MKLIQKISRLYSENLGRSAQKTAIKEKGVIGAPALPKELKPKK
ncbi:hypothetical protein [Paenibacillus amylolyticus]|uniref:Uncharacterized protein n=1 Tax=Paenibacillus amylolyticus TaxID=1451 RepID=A0ABD8B2U4_PAEAM